MQLGSRMEKAGTPRDNNQEWLKEEEAVYEAVEDNDLTSFLSEEKDSDEEDSEQERNLEKLREELPDGLFLCADFVDEQTAETLLDIYNNYATAMRRRNREPLPEQNFVSHFFRGGSFDALVMFGDNDLGYILGFWKHQVFVPTHFAPKTLRGGYELFKELSSNQEVPVVLAITEDLKDTLVKMDGWHVLDFSFLSFFRDNLMEKVIVYNSHPEVKERMMALASEFMSEHQSDPEEVVEGASETPTP